MPVAHASQVLSLRSEMQAMAADGKQSLPAALPAAGSAAPAPAEELGAVDAASLLSSPPKLKVASTPPDAGAGVGGEGGGAAAERGRGAGGGGESELTPLQESALQGKLIQAELIQEQLKAARASAIKETADLQRQFNDLLKEKQEVAHRLNDLNGPLMTP